MTQRLRNALAGLILAFTGIAAASSAQTVPEPSSGEATGAPQAETVVSVKGFRSATFGMTEAQARAAAAKDFNVNAEKIALQTNPIDRTTSFSVPTKDMLAETGPAQVTYIFGYKSKKLIQINVVWGGTISPDLKRDTALVIANTLYNYFATAGYKADSIVSKVQLKDGSIIVFRGVDAESHMTILTLTEGAAPPPNTKASTVLLQLTYTMDPQNLDIYKIAPGQF